MKKINLTRIYPLFCGIFGCLASVVGKYIFMEDDHWPIQPNIVYRIMCFLLTIYCNKWMLYFQFKSLELNGSILTTVISFISNSFISIITGIFLYKEGLSIHRVVGFVLIWMGILLIESEKKEEKKVIL